MKDIVTGLGAIALGSSQAYSEESDGFVFKNHPDLASYILKGYHSSRVDDGDLYFVDVGEIVMATPEYNPIKIGDVKKGTGKYEITLVEASDKGLNWIDNYFQDKEGVVVSKRALRNYDVLFENVPDKYTGKSLNGIADELDHTQEVIDYNK